MWHSIMRGRRLKAGSIVSNSHKTRHTFLNNQHLCPDQFTESEARRQFRYQRQSGLPPKLRRSLFQISRSDATGGVMDYPAAPAWPGSNRDLTLQYKVHLGIWTDWSRGRVLGITLTLDRQQANFLIAFTASFIVFVGSRFWYIICVFLHQVYSTSEPRDALHHQRQVVLRNSGASEAGVVS